jgi:excisionase family DNA binding protein
MDKQKDILTTGQVAKICNVAPRTVSKWFDSGQLRGYRIPGSKDRRIPRQQLLRFMKLHDIPMDKLETGQRCILIVDDDTDLTDVLHRHLEERSDDEVEIARSLFEAGAAIERFQPTVVLMDVDLWGFDAPTIRRFFASHPELSGTRLVAMGASLTAADCQTLLQQGFSETLPKPFTIQQLTDLIEEPQAVAP